MRKVADGKAEKTNKKDGEDDAQAGFDEVRNCEERSDEL